MKPGYALSLLFLNLTYLAFCSRLAHITYLEFQTYYTIGLLVSQQPEFKCKEIVTELKQTVLLD